VYGEKIREICKAAEIRQSITDQLVTASPQEKKTHPKPTPIENMRYIRYKIQDNNN
jgi:hypothetical protein